MNVYFIVRRPTTEFPEYMRDLKHPSHPVFGVQASPKGSRGEYLSPRQKPAEKNTHLLIHDCAQGNNVPLLFWDLELMRCK